MNRRGFLKGILAAAMAPAIVKAENLMKIAPLRGFTGVGEILIPDQSLFNMDLSGDFTVESWIKPTGEWMHFAMTKSCNSLGEFVTKEYINGNEVPIGSHIKACGGLQINFDGDQLKIETVSSEPFNGYIDELRVEKGAPKVSVPFNFHEPLGINAKWLK